MSRRWLPVSIVLLPLGLFGCGDQPDVAVGVQVEVTSVQNPPEAQAGADDDRLERKSAAFDPALVDPRPFGFWSINQSEAILGLHVPATDPRVMELQSLYPNHQAAANSVVSGVWLPSVNQIDGQAKQFDDGLLAAVDLALLQRSGLPVVGHLPLLQRMLDRAEAGSAAVPFLSAAMTLGGVSNEFSDSTETREWIRKFESDETVSQPIGVYTWSQDLRRCWAATAGSVGSSAP